MVTQRFSKLNTIPLSSQRLAEPKLFLECETYYRESRLLINGELYPKVVYEALGGAPDSLGFLSNSVFKNRFPGVPSATLLLPLKLVHLFLSDSISFKVIVKPILLERQPPVLPALNLTVLLLP